MHYRFTTTHAAGPPGVCACGCLGVCVCACMCLSVCVYVCVMKLVQRESLCRAAVALPFYYHTRSWASRCVCACGCLGVCMCVHVCVSVCVCHCVCDETSSEAVLVQSSCCITGLQPHTQLGLQLCAHLAGWVCVYVRACVCMCVRCVCVCMSVCV